MELSKRLLSKCSLKHRAMGYNSCQSCGIPFDRAAGKGTNADGTANNMYCSYCFTNGAFVQPDWTAEDMRQYANKKLQQKGIPSFLADMLTSGIPKLERWNPKSQD